MIKVGKILVIMGIFGGFFLIFFAFVDFFVGGWEQLGAPRSTRSVEEMVGTGAWLGLALASFSECSECSECSDDKKVWGGGFGIFFLWGLGFFCKFAEMLWFFF